MSRPEAGTAPASRPGWAESLSRRAVLRALSRIEEGRLRLREAQGDLVFGRPGETDPLEAVVEVEEPAFWSDLALGGALGAAESYLAGRWRADDLTTALRILARTPERGGYLDRGLARLRGPVRRLLHWLRRNDRRGAKRNIAAHYDLGNAFFGRWLDESMTYSCALWEPGVEDLAGAQARKLDRICRKLDLPPEGEAPSTGPREILEIGTGWGSFALEAARRGARVTTTTLSREQAKLARQRAGKAGLEDRIEVLESDYRDLPRHLGERRFDGLVSIEMIEAVGHENLPVFFQTCGSLLRADGRMVLQAILMSGRNYHQYRRSVDFIQRYVFPGGHLPSLEAIHAALARSGDLETRYLEDWTPHYPPTLRAWRERFAQSWEEIRPLGFDDRFRRLWEYYLCYCEAGFLERNVGVIQMVLSRPRDAGASVATAEEGAADHRGDSSWS